MFEAKKHKIRFALSKHLLFRESDYNLKNYFNHDCVVIFPELNLCFNRIKKAGNTSVCAYLAQVCGYPDFDSPHLLKENLIRPETASLKLLAKSRTYHSLVVVRNPFDRTLSAFLDKVGGDKSGRFSNYGGYRDDSARGFLEFLKHLDALPNRGNRHFWPQTELLYKPLNAYTLVAKLENLSQVLPPFLKDLTGQSFDGSIFEKPHKVEVEKEGKIKMANEKLRQYYIDESINLVKKIFKNDFESLDYPDELSI